MGHAGSGSWRRWWRRSRSWRRCRRRSWRRLARDATYAPYLARQAHGCRAAAAGRGRRPADRRSTTGRSAGSRRSCAASSSWCGRKASRQAARIEGMTPAALTQILLRVRQRRGPARGVMSAGAAEAFQAAFDVSRETMARLETHLRAAAAVEPADQPGLARQPRRRLGPALRRLGAALAASAAGRPPLARPRLRRRLPGPGRRRDGRGRRAGLRSAPGGERPAQGGLSRDGRPRDRGRGDGACRARRGPAAAWAPTSFPRARWPRSTPSSRMAEKHRRPGGIGLFPKGASVHKEIAEAAVRWHFDHAIHPSLTDPRAAIVEIGATRRV